MYAGRIDIIDNHGGCAAVWHKMEELDAENLRKMLNHAKTIVAALGDSWKIHYNTGDGYIKIGPKNPQTIDAKKALGMPITTPVMLDAWLTTIEVETEYGLPKSSVRRDIHRNKFNDDEIKKVGRDWIVRMDAANRLYDKRMKNVSKSRD